MYQKIIENITPVAIAAFFFFLIGKMTGVAATVAVLAGSNSAVSLISLYAGLIFISILLCLYDGYKTKTKNFPSKEEVRELAKQYGLLNE